MLLSRTDTPAPIFALADVKAHLRVDIPDDDMLIQMLVDVATSRVDGITGYLKRSLLTQTYRWRLPYPPVGSELHLPLPPLQSVTSIQYYDASNVLQTYNASNYNVFTDAETGYLKLLAGSSWPAMYQRDDAMIVTFVAGYGASGSAVPTPIRQALLLAIGRLYANRGDEGAPLTDLSMAEKSLLNPYRLTQFDAPHRRFWNTSAAHNV